MDQSLLTTISDAIADAVDAVAPSVVQVQGRRRPASGVVYANDVVVTTASALGRGDSFRVRRHDGETRDAELAGWDPATSLAVLRVGGLGVATARISQVPPRVGHIAVAVARSWSNAITASAGIIAVIGGPLQTGRRRAIEQVIRTTAPTHDGFAGGAFADTSGALIGLTTAASIRGLEVVIPAAIAWRTAAVVLAQGGSKRGYLGLASQPVRLTDAQRREGDSEHALLIVGITPGSPAAAAGLMVGDVLATFDGHRVSSPEDLLDLLVADRIGRTVALGVERGTTWLEVPIIVGERPAH
jgi:S1-C subfamily serine protease